MIEEVARFIEKAEHALTVAMELLKSGYPADAVSKVYYSMFYSTQAVLKSEGIDVIKHSAVEAAFGLHFVKSGKIDSRYHRMLIQARKLRETADYDISEEVTAAIAFVKVEEGKSFLQAIKGLLGIT